MCIENMEAGGGEKVHHDKKTTGPSKTKGNLFKPVHMWHLWRPLSVWFAFKPNTENIKRKEGA